MPVTPQVREAELEIDNWIAGLSYWYAPRDLLLERLIDYYRNVIDILFAKVTHDAMFGLSSGVTILEDRMRAGVFQAIKWAMEFCKVQGRGRANLDRKGMERLVTLGQLYEVLVDAITSAQVDALAIDAHQRSTYWLSIKDRTSPATTPTWWNISE